MYLQPRPSYPRSASRTTIITPIITAYPSTCPLTQTNKKNPDTMELDPRTQGYVPKNSAEQQKYIKEGYYFKCSSKTYLSLDCSILIPYTILMEILLPRIDSCLPSPGGISLNELPREWVASPGNRKSLPFCVKPGNARLLWAAGSVKPAQL